MMGNLENSSDEFVAVSPRVDNVLIHNTGKLSRSSSQTARFKCGKSEELGAIRDSIFVVICFCIIHHGVHILRRSCAKC